MNIKRLFKPFSNIPVAEAHCDGPCGVYDPAAARITAEAVRSMTKKMLDLPIPDRGDAAAAASYMNTMARFASIKEEQAESTKHELLVLWTDFFKPEHLEANPDLHETFWNGRDDTGLVVASGVYLVRLKGRDFVETQRVALMK